MRASSVTGQLPAWPPAWDWAWWRLPGTLRAYIGAVPALALVLITAAAVATPWRPGEEVKFLLLLSCGAVSVVATPRFVYLQSGLMRDFLTAWVLPVAILLPPVYAMVIPAPLLALTQWRVHRGVVYRRVFSGAAIGLAYGAASVVFHAIPPSFAGTAPEGGRHALTWIAAVVVAEVTGLLLHKFLIVGAVKLSDPTARVAEVMLDREAR